MIRSVVLSMLASLWPNGSTQRARVWRLDYIEDYFLSAAASVLGTEMASSPRHGHVFGRHARRLAGDGETKPGAAKALRRRGGWSRNKEISPSSACRSMGRPCTSRLFLAVP
jgi:hypothetical protein